MLASLLAGGCASNGARPETRAPTVTVTSCGDGPPVSRSLGEMIGLTLAGALIGAAHGAGIGAVHGGGAGEAAIIGVAVGGGIGLVLGTVKAVREQWSGPCADAT